MKRHLIALLSAALSLCALAAPAVVRGDDSGDSGPKKIDLTKNPRIIAYQLHRMSNAELAGLERKTDDPKYKPVYDALLVRKGLEKKYRQESVDALAKLNKSNAVTEILSAIGHVEADDRGTMRDLVGMLLLQKSADLKAQRARLEEFAVHSDAPTVRQVAYAAIATGDGSPDAVWSQAKGDPDGLHLLLGGIPLITDLKLREAFYPHVKPLVEKAPDAQTRVAAIDAISYLPGHEEEAFKLLADIVKTGKGGERAAAVRSVGRITHAKWPKDQVGPLAHEVVKLVGEIPADKRTEPEAVQAVQLGNDLSSALPAAEGAPIRKSLRELGVRVVLIQTLREQLLFDLHYFVVQGGKPVQVILKNDDAMPHNLVITQPGKMEDVAKAGAAVPPGGDPNEKAFVPTSPDVLESTHLVQGEGDSIKLSFNAPAKAGEYPFVCTFPGHAERMHGIMLVVDDIDAWDKNPKPPTDPVTHKPFESQKNEGGGPPPPAAHEHQ